MSNKKMNKCKNEFCNEYVKRGTKKTKEIFEKIIESSKYDKEKKDKLRIKMKKDLEKAHKEFKNICHEYFCNPGCKGTSYQNGSPNKLPKDYVQRLEKLFKKQKQVMSKEYIDMLITWRKKLFKNKTSVLNNSFYKKLNKKTIKTLKNKGALSGCTTTMLF